MIISLCCYRVFNEITSFDRLKDKGDEGRGEDEDGVDVEAGKRKEKGKGKGKGKADEDGRLDIDGKATTPIRSASYTTLYPNLRSKRAC